MIPFISGDEVRRRVPMAKAITLMEDAFRAISNDDAVVPQRINMPLASEDCSLVMPVYVKNSDYYMIKTVSINRDNPKHGKPLIHALITLFSASSGEPLALIDGESVTALRTGAAAGLATDYLAEANAQRLAVFGTGIQAEAQIEAICEVRGISHIDVFGRDKTKTEKFAESITARFAPCRVGALNDLSEADIISLATTSHTPLFEGIKLKPNCHINGVGSYRKDMVELHPQYVKNCEIVVDQRNAALSEAGDITQAIDAGIISATDIFAELGEIVQDSAKRLSQGQSFFKSVGNAAQDFFVAVKVNKTQ